MHLLTIPPTWWLMKMTPVHVCWRTWSSIQIPESQNAWALTVVVSHWMNITLQLELWQRSYFGSEPLAISKWNCDTLFCQRVMWNCVATAMLCKQRLPTCPPQGYLPFFERKHRCWKGGDISPSLHIQQIPVFMHQSHPVPHQINRQMDQLHHLRVPKFKSQCDRNASWKKTSCSEGLDLLAWYIDAYWCIDCIVIVVGDSSCQFYVFLGVLGELTLFATPPPVQVWQRLRPAFAQVRLQSLCVPHLYISLLQPLVDGPFGFSAKNWSMLCHFVLQHVQGECALLGGQGQSEFINAWFPLFLLCSKVWCCQRRWATSKTTEMI